MNDGLFSVGKNEKLCTVFAPVNGRVIPQGEIPDEVFSTGMLGEGIGIIPEDGEFFSPISGKVIDVTPTLHAYSLLSDDGAEILLHIGIDTVELKGRGFKSLVKTGDRVEVGSPLARADLDLIRKEGYSTVLAMIIINPDMLSQITTFEGKCKAFESEILKYVVNKKNKQK